MAKETSILCILCLVNHVAKCQELEPRAYAALPKNLNSVVIAYGFSSGNILTDASLPIAGVKMTMHNLAAAYVHTFGLGTKLARIQVTVPFVYVIGKLQYNGRDTSGSRMGFGDAKIRFGINLTGTPVLDKKEFRHYTQKTIIGVSLVTSVPTGLYHPDKYINAGSYRWAFKPEVGISKRFKQIYAETYAGIWFYTDNNKFHGDKTLKQKPVFNIQAHASYYFRNRMWVSVNTTWFNGGHTTVDDMPNGDLLDSWRIGASWSFPIARAQSLKLQFHIGAYTATGYDYNVISLVYQNVF